ncbi:uncharacterized protein HKW66_Vig0167840 [Vigna angularis]|uniref:Uncharacterized protein n=1 Tax=Phaseolus angularis TaxID=3914 RepID=A0A8T0JP19_PHAAN|nr:uncharacterized protein HKW66_Vig0167840 [Vigna angularis]
MFLSEHSSKVHQQIPIYGEVEKRYTHDPLLSQFIHSILSGAAYLFDRPIARVIVGDHDILVSKENLQIIEGDDLEGFASFKSSIRRDSASHKSVLDDPFISAQTNNHALINSRSQIRMNSTVCSCEHRPNEHTLRDSLDLLETRRCTIQ